MLRCLIFSLLLFCGFHSYSQDEQPKTWLWQISGGELQGKSYLFGSMPLQDSTYYRFDSKLWKNVSKSDVFLSFKDEISDQQEQVYVNAPKQYSLTPKNYIKQQLEVEFKPVVELDESNSLATLVTGGLSKKATPEELMELKEAYLSADIQSFMSLRSQLDVPESVLSSLEKKHNYILINELVRQMQLQPVFIALDPVYLTGTEGLVALFKARGYQVKPLSEKFYEKNALSIAALNQQRQLFTQQNSQQQPIQNTSVPAVNTTETIKAPSTPTTRVNLDLPIGILNLDQWTAYEIDDPKVKYMAPLRLKQSDDNRPGRYVARSGDLEYQIDVVDKWENTNAQIEQIIIQNGGQVVLSERFENERLSGQHIELMYTDNEISRHLLVAGLQKNLIVSVKGKTPSIHTILADQFLNEITVEQLPDNNPIINIPFVNKPTTPDEPATVVQWAYQNLPGAQFIFPSDFIEEEAKLEGGETVKAFISSRKVDNNTFVLVSSKKESFDNFQLFNTSINQAATEVRGVILERNVMPEGRNNFAEYQIKDAVGRYYRIQYHYLNGRFYQAIVKGDKKSVTNGNANQFLSSLYFQ